MKLLPLALVFGPLMLSACGSSEPAFGGGGRASPAPAAGKYDVTVTRTALGIPHIKAADFGSMGYGYGYAFAEDNLCTLQDDLVTVRGERARYFGPEGTYSIPANRSVANNVDSDFFWRLMATNAAIAPLRAHTDPEFQKATIGFADGYNRYIAELKAGGHPGRHLACRDAEWLFPITEADMIRRYYRLALIASSSVFVSGIGAAQPPLPGAAVPAPTAEQTRLRLEQDLGPLAFFDPEKRAFGSNMYALGPQATASGQPIVFGNPHFPWTGTERLYISHLQMPGFEIMGASLYGVPAVNIGFNRHFAWSHTVSTAYRFTLYQLVLNPLNPTQYLYDGALRDMVPTELTIQAKQPDGSLADMHRTLYRTHYGPMVGLMQSLPGAGTVNLLPWTNAVAFTLRDANAENDALIDQFARWNRAQSLTEFKDLQKSILGVPWVNTVAAGPNQPAYYADITVVPHVTDAQRQTCNAQPLSTVFGQVVAGLPLLDGSRSACEWGSDPDAPRPGIFGPGNLPSMERDDWVANNNDSYWLTNPAAPIEGYNSIIGPERTARSLRTRLAMLQVLRRLDGSDGRPGNRFDYVQLQDTVLDSQLLSEQLARADVLATVCALPLVVGQAGPVDPAEACEALTAWDGKANLDSRGAHLWREFWRRVMVPGGLPANPFAAVQWLTPFSATDPVNTPSGLNVALPHIQAALADAIAAVEAAGFALDAPLGEVQFSAIHSPETGGDIPLFGGTGTEGSFTIVSGPAIGPRGLRIDYGNSYIQAVTWEPDGTGFKPHAEGFITYSQSTDPANPHFADFTREYSAKRWKHLPFTDAEIAADTIDTMHLSQ
ncbi:MAG TPA: penicillin acylase family protein [Solimonas sp.]|nr:penicillin acylase family protein [Solimonas sp.]